MDEEDEIDSFDSSFFYKFLKESQLKFHYYLIILTTFLMINIKSIKRILFIRLVI